VKRASALALTAAAISALALAGVASAFVPAEPLAAQQWYLAQDHAFDAWTEPPTLALFTPVKVAIVDSGIDANHPEFLGKIVGGRSFVGGDWRVDRQGHGTFVAGVIAANLDQQGIVGLAYPAARLLIAKVVRNDGQIPVDAEAAAIRWAADEGARVINLSFGAPRDPRSSEIDAFSQVEADAVAYAYQKGAVLVAAVGNGDEAPRTPWPWASYPAALPHVIGVSALTRTGSVPSFSNRDRLYNDISAPGQDIFSTFPRSLAVGPCTDPGYSDCATDDYRHARGTSFAAPQVTAAAAMLISLDPVLRPDQVSWVLERSADDASASNGCSVCALQRDPYSGWGHLNIARAIGSLQGPIPPPDLYESNDEAGVHAHTVYGKRGRITATLDYWDDQLDVYRIRLLKGERLSAQLVGSPGSNIDLILWDTKTKRVDDLASQRFRLTQSARPGSHESITYKAKQTGWYFMEAKTTNTGTAVYGIDFAKV
jgi:hypothetical protein